MSTSPLYLEDLSAGTIFSGGTSAPLTREDIISFATQFDPQPFHLDDQAAQKSFFKELVASGWHTAAITMRMLVEGELQFEGGMIGTSGEISWRVPVKPGDQLRVKGEITEVLPSHSVAGHGFVKIRTETWNQREQLVQKMMARLMVRSRNG